MDKTIKLWDAASGKEIRAFKGHTHAVTNVCFSIDARYIYSGSFDTSIKLWDVASGEEIRTFRGHGGAVTSICIVKDGRHIISGSDDYTIKLWNLESEECIRTIELQWIPFEIKEVPAKPYLFATANGNGTVTFFDFKNMIL